MIAAGELTAFVRDTIRRKRERTVWDAWLHKVWDETEWGESRARFIPAKAEAEPKPNREMEPSDIVRMSLSVCEMTRKGVEQ